MKLNLEALMARKDHGKTEFERKHNLLLAIHGERVLKDYFSKFPDSDVAIIREGALNFDYMLHNYSDRNIVLFTPSSSYKLTREQSFEGRIMPYHNLLLFDSDMFTGFTILETKAFFASKGYLREHMHVYLHLGLSFNSKLPELKQVDEMLEHHRLSWPPELPKPHKSTFTEISALPL